MRVDGPQRRGGALILALLVAGLVLVGSPNTAALAVAQGDQGLQAGWAVDDSGDVNFQGSVATLLPYITAAGAGWVRINFRLGGCFTNWTSVGCNGRTALQTYDDVIATAQAQHLQVLGLISNESWQGDQSVWVVNNAETVPNGTGDNAYIQNFAQNAAGVLAQHFGSSISSWEVWNEPNAWTSTDGQGHFSGGSYMYPSNFAWLLRRSYSAIKAVQPSAQVLMGGLFAHEPLGVTTTMLVDGRPTQVVKRADMPNARQPALRGAQPSLAAAASCVSHVPSGADSGASYLCATYSVAPGYAGWVAGASPYDDVGHHPYLSADGSLAPATLSTYVQDLHDAVLTYEGAASPRRTHVTEIGWPTTQVSPQVQADNLRVAFQTLRSTSFVARTYWFNIEDTFAGNVFFGLLEDDGTHRQKPSFAAYQTYATFTSANGCPCSLWAASAAPGTQTGTDSNSVEVGLKFRSDVAGTINGIRFYKRSTNTGAHVGSLWSSTGTLLSQATFGAESASGWQQVNLSTPVQIAANTVYVVSYHTSNGQYAATQNAFISAGLDTGVLHAPSSPASGGNGVYTYGSTSAFPTGSYQGSNYWVDVVFATNSVSPTATPTASSTSTRTLTPTPSLTPTQTPVVTSTPTPSLTPTPTRTTTPTATPTSSSGCPCSLWTMTTSPGAQNGTDSNSVELGLKFGSDVAGTISGIRFYKRTTNTGAHVGSVWSSTGTLLAQATFSAESASGWQQVNLSTPVQIAANTVYVVSYHASNGQYAATQNAFTSAGLDNGVLHAPSSPASGGNGVYRYGPTSAFPSSSYLGSNYWVDVVYTPN
jgi:hypothetical protein